MGTRDTENSPLQAQIPYDGVICSGIDLYNIYTYSLSFSATTHFLPPTKRAHHRNQPAYNPSTTPPSIRFTLSPLPRYHFATYRRRRKKKREKSRDVVSCCCRSAGCAAAVRPAHEPRTDSVVRLVRRVSLFPPMFGNGGV